MSDKGNKFIMKLITEFRKDLILTLPRIYMQDMSLHSRQTVPHIYRQGAIHQRRFGSLYWSPTHPPPHPRAYVSQYILRFGRFYAQYGPHVWDGGVGGVCQTDDVGQGGWPKSQFLIGRLWRMTPYCIFNLGRFLPTPLVEICLVNTSNISTNTVQTHLNQHFVNCYQHCVNFY